MLLLCLLTPETDYEELRNALSQAYSDPASRAVLRDDPYGLIGVVMLQWLTWSQKLFYQLEQLVLSTEMDLESDLDDDPASGTGAKTCAKTQAKRQAKTQAKTQAAKEVNFSEMHRIARHIIQYLDTLHTTTRLQDSVIQCHERLWKARFLCTDDNSAFQSVKDALQYCALVSIGVESRVEGLKSRMDNQIALVTNQVSPVAVLALQCCQSYADLTTITGRCRATTSSNSGTHS